MATVSELTSTKIKLAVSEIANIQLQFERLQLLGQQKVKERDDLVKAARAEAEVDDQVTYNLDTGQFNRGAEESAKPKRLKNG